MKAFNNSSQHNFLCPLTRYYGKFTPNTFIFNANLQDFACRVNYISNLHTGGKLSSEEAYQQVEVLWKQLTTAKKTMISLDGDD
ncbi:conserved hypothetical protein [Rippkaea orientalis PCC 8801]|uniref:Isopropylmalate/homocitrate/citramalate synthase n=1 Tax=Rippkaea orientalis (strain PCC 8801 / RF-1) TaxID=41431 RepID=B7JWQ9_RIPO1|nr:hypothetical protein [Rippkaea orientalis]ACK64705.1 conserved hypothetical protein [Rippkaea orientalis PCC 8801]